MEGEIQKKPPKSATEGGDFRKTHSSHKGRSSSDEASTSDTGVLLGQDANAPDECWQALVQTGVAAAK